MVHALERARQALLPNSPLVLIQPHQTKRSLVAVTSGRRRQPVAALVNSTFQPRLDAAVSAIRTVIDGGRFSRVGTSHHQFRVHLANPADLRRYLHLAPTPSRFPAGGRQRLNDLWRSRTEGARIEVTESFTVIGLRRMEG
jgi:hypothetical protein